MVTPAARRQALEILKSKGLSERAACRFAGVSRRVVNYELKQPAKDQALGAQLIAASSRYPRFGYRRIAVMTDTKVSRVWRLWSKLGLNLPKRRPRKRRCGSDIRIPGSTAPTAYGRMISCMTSWPMVGHSRCCASWTRIRANA